MSAAAGRLTGLPRRGAALLLRPLAADEHRARFWLRHVRVGVALTEVTAVVVFTYLVVADRPHRDVVTVLLVLVTLGSPLMLRLPVARLSATMRGPLLFYLWSATITVVIAVLGLLDGGADSPLMWLLTLTLSFAALAYPPAGVLVMGVLMVGCYVGVAAVTDTLDSAAVLVGCVLALFTVMTAWVSRNRWETHEEQLRLTARLAEVDRAREEFVATTSHELRTPVASILGYVELLEDSDADLGPDAAAFLTTIRRNAERLRNLSEDLLVLSGTDSARRLSLAVGNDRVDLATVVDRVLDTMAPLATGQDVALRVVPSAEPLVVAGSADQLEQAVLNLLSNAVKYTPAGGHVEVRLVPEGDEAVVEVADSGIGISPEDVERLFTRFFRASSARDRSIAGVGLGLSIVKEVLEVHAGRVDVTSVLGEGTTFVVRLPRVLAPADVPPADDAVLAPTG